MTNPQSASAHSELELDGIAYRRRGAPMIDGVSLLIAPGELVALLGPRDSGKTTLLNVIAGQIRQKSGHVRVDKVEVGRLPPKRRRIGIVAGYDALLPNRTVAQNVAHGIGSMWIKRRARSARVREVLDLVRAEGVADRYPRQLSIGQQQRVLIARALVMQPNILLLDEPFANLDRTARLDQQIELKRIQRSTGLTMVLATQDPEEALTLADRIALLNRGKLEQFASPSDIYDHPASLFASNFIGTANILSGKVVLAGGGQYTIGLGVGGTVLATSPVVLQVGTAVRVCLRPEALAITPHPDGLPATVELGWPLGACLMHELRLADGSGVKSASPRKVGDDPMPAGTEVRLRQQSLAIAFPEEST